MAIRLEFYAEDQVIATGVVEYAISRGAVLQAYTEVDAPLKRGPKAAAKSSPIKKRKRSKRVSNMNRTVQCVNSDLPMAKGSSLYKCAKVIVGFTDPTPVREIYTAVKKAGLSMNNAYPAMRHLMDIGHIVEA